MDRAFGDDGSGRRRMRNPGSGLQADREHRMCWSNRRAKWPAPRPCGRGRRRPFPKIAGLDRTESAKARQRVPVRPERSARAQSAAYRGAHPRSRAIRGSRRRVKAWSPPWQAVPRRPWGRSSAERNRPRGDRARRSPPRPPRAARKKGCVRPGNRRLVKGPAETLPDSHPDAARHLDRAQLEGERRKATLPAGHEVGKRSVGQNARLRGKPWHPRRERRARTPPRPGRPTAVPGRPDRRCRPG